MTKTEIITKWLYFAFSKRARFNQLEEYAASAGLRLRLSPRGNYQLWLGGTLRYTCKTAWGLIKMVKLLKDIRKTAPFNHPQSHTEPERDDWHFHKISR